MAVAMVGLVLAIVWALAASSGEVDPGRVALLMASFGLAIAATTVWGSRAAWAWLIAALSYEVLGGLRDAVYGPEWQARGAGALTVVGGCALIALIVRYAARRAAIAASALNGPAPVAAI